MDSAGGAEAPKAPPPPKSATDNFRCLDETDVRTSQKKNVRTI